MTETRATETFYDRLLRVLSSDPRLVSKSGEFLHSEAMTLGNQMDAGLLEILLRDEVVRARLFTDVSGTLVFDKQHFGWLVTSSSFLPDSYTRFKNEIGLIDSHGKMVIPGGRDIELVWPYKDCVLEGGQTKEEQGRKEVFYNETLAPDQVDTLLAPKVFTRAMRHNRDGVRPVTEIESDDNLIVKGNNLLVLSSLAGRYAGKVKLVYIDPPFGSNQDGFDYNERFRISTWLTFMKNRLEIAKKMLSEDGALFLHISDVRVSHIRLLLDDVFGPENFINLITVRTKSPSGWQTVNAGVFETAEYIYAYAKKKASWSYRQQFVATGYDTNYNLEIVNLSDPVDQWRVTSIREAVAFQMGFLNARKAQKADSEAFASRIAKYAFDNRSRVFQSTAIGDDAGGDTVDTKNMAKDQRNRVFRVPREGREDRLVYKGRELSSYDRKVRNLDGVLTPTMALTNIWTDISYEGIAAEGGVRLKKGKKPERLIRRIIGLGSDQGDRVMDFFMGSGTTQAVAHKMGRRYIGVEQLDYIDTMSIPRLDRVIAGEPSGVSRLEHWTGGGSFIACELMELNESVVKRVMEAATTDDLLAIWGDVRDSGFISYRVRPEAFDPDKFSALKFTEQQQAIIATLDKNNLYVNRCDIDDADCAVDGDDKAFNASLYAKVEP